MNKPCNILKSIFNACLEFALEGDYDPADVKRVIPRHVMANVRNNVKRDNNEGAISCLAAYFQGQVTAPDDLQRTYTAMVKQVNAYKRLPDTFKNTFKNTAPATLSKRDI